MCTNFQPVSKKNIRTIEFSDPLLKYKSDIFINDYAPIYFKKFGSIEWRVAKFGLSLSNKDYLQHKLNNYNIKFEVIRDSNYLKTIIEKSQFCLIPVEAVYETAFKEGKLQLFRISRKDNTPFTIAGIYDYSSKKNKFSMAMLTIEADSNLLMSQLNDSEYPMRSIVIIPEEKRADWLSCTAYGIEKFLSEIPKEEFCYTKVKEVH